MRTPKILFVCFADSIHSQSWINLLQGSEFEVRVFASPVDFGGMYPPIQWYYPTYTLYKPAADRPASKVYWLLPTSRWVRPVTRRIAARFDLPRLWLRRVILSWKPDVVHSLSFDMGAYLTWNVLKDLPKTKRPKWVISSWGTDIYLGMLQPETRIKLSTCLQECNGFVSDCWRDIENAKSLGLAANKVLGNHPFPVNGGFDLEEFDGLLQDLESRKLILIPKAYENIANKTLPVLEALRLCEDILRDYQIRLLVASNEVQLYVKRLPLGVQERCHCSPYVSRHEILRMLGRARVMIAPSLSDGTPVTMLEAMVLGALPVMSPVPSILEWIRDGENGLLAHALYPDQIALALRRALSDDDLWRRATQSNRRIVAERANRRLIRKEVLDFYRDLSAA